MRTEKQKLGQWGEEQAALFLIGEGYKIVERNYRVKEGEADIIAWCRDWENYPTLSFIEVKTRSYGAGSAERATDKQKLEQMFKAARGYCFIKYIDIERTSIKFEQISIYTDSRTGKTDLKKYVIPID